MSAAKRFVAKFLPNLFLTNLGELSEQLHVQISIQYLLSIQWSSRSRLSGIEWSKCGRGSGEEQSWEERGVWHEKKR